MLTNDQFLDVIKESFEVYLNVGTSRSTAKLKSLHGAIAKDLQKEFGENFSVKAQGIYDDKESVVNGRYYPKNIDIAIFYKNKPVACYGVKFVVRNYSQNSNNYFENMLGETANIRTGAIPYFQIFILFDKLPHFKNGGILKKYDIITYHNIEKYILLSKDNPSEYFHTPNITLILLLTLKEDEKNILFNSSSDYAKYYKSKIKTKDLITYSSKIKDKFGQSVEFNNYENFIKRSVFYVKGVTKI